MIRVAVLSLLLIFTFATVGCGQEPDDTAGTPQQTRAETPQESFHAFWSEFREAVLQDDIAKIAAMTRFPFRTRGPWDGDPVLTHSRDSFDSLFRELIDQDPGLRPESETMQDLIQRTTTVSLDQTGDGEGIVRVGDFVFENVEGRWSFAMAYRAQD